MNEAVMRFLAAAAVDAGALQRLMDDPGEAAEAFGLDAAAVGPFADRDLPGIAALLGYGPAKPSVQQQPAVWYWVPFLVPGGVAPPPASVPMTPPRDESDTGDV